jgi:hypothetical protein
VTTGPRIVEQSRKSVALDVPRPVYDMLYAAARRMGRTVQGEALMRIERTFLLEAIVRARMNDATLTMSAAELRLMVRRDG